MTERPTGAHQRPRETGFTLVELMVVVALMSGITLALLTIFSSSETVVAEMNANAQADSELLRVMDRLQSELDFADPDSVVVLSPQAIRFSVVEGWDGSATVLGAPRSLALVGDRLVLDTTTLVTGVTGLNMNLTDDLLSIDLTIQTDYSEGAGTRTVTRDTVIVHRFGT